MPARFTLPLLAILVMLSACAGPSYNPNVARDSARPEVGHYYSLLEAAPMMAGMNQLYDKTPDLRKGDEGELKQSQKDKALEMLNTIRALHELPPVSYHPESDINTARASLIMTANRIMTHHPKKNLKFWSEEGAKGAATSNLFHGSLNGYGAVGFSTEYFMNNWIIDNEVESLGHRRWMLSPSLKYTSFGRVDGNGVSSAALKVIFDERQDPGDKVAYVAYPYKEYPAALFNGNWYLSFSALRPTGTASETPAPAKYKKLVDYKKAKIHVYDENGKRLGVHKVKYSYDGFGVDNVLQWKVKKLAVNRQYRVVIKNVLLKGIKTDYEYTFKLI